MGSGKLSQVDVRKGGYMQGLRVFRTPSIVCLMRLSQHVIQFNIPDSDIHYR